MTVEMLHARRFAIERVPSALRRPALSPAYSSRPRRSFSSASHKAGLSREDRVLAAHGGWRGGRIFASSPFSQVQPLIRPRFSISGRTSPLAAAHVAAMRTIARFMFIAIATN